MKPLRLMSLTSSSPIAFCVPYDVLRRQRRVVGHGIGQRSAEYRERAREHEFRRRRAAAATLEQAARRIDVDAHADVELGFGLPADDRGKMKHAVGVRRDAPRRRPQDRRGCRTIARTRGSPGDAGATTSTSTSSRIGRDRPRASVSAPRSSIARARRLPRKPAPPVMTTRISVLSPGPAAAIACASVSACSSASARSRASTITRNTGSVPDGRSSTRPAAPSDETAARSASTTASLSTPVEPALHGHVDQALRKQRQRRRRLRERRLLLDQRAQHRERGDDRIAGRVLVEADQMCPNSRPPSCQPRSSIFSST